VYYSDGLCTVDEIAINELGMCDACITVDIPEDYLKEKRDEILEQLEMQYEE